MLHGVGRPLRRAVAQPRTWWYLARSAPSAATSHRCRFGPTLADGYQGRGVGTLVFPLVADVARLRGRTRIILRGGVRADNPRAIRYHEKNGFQLVGSFSTADGSLSLDMMLDLHSVPDPRIQQGL